MMTSAVLKKLLKAILKRHSIEDTLLKTLKPGQLGKDMVATGLTSGGIKTLVDLLMKSQGMQQGGYYNTTKYEDNPHFTDQAPVLQRNNPKYKWQFVDSDYYNSPKLWGNPPAEERYWSDPNVKRVFPDYFNEAKSMLKDRFGHGTAVEPNDVRRPQPQGLTGEPRYKE